jgi:type IV pilus assembly protein PilO
MALKMNVSLRNVPSVVKIILSAIPALVITLVVVFLLIFPKQKEIKGLEQKISAQENEIAKNQAKAAKLPELTLENERLRVRLNELKLQLPEEKEVSTLLKQVSDLCIGSGLKIGLWKPEQRKTHPSGIVYEIPVKVELIGNYHSLGYFFSSLTKLSRIVNISDIKISDPKAGKENALVKISFVATTFSVVPEEEIQTKQEEPGKGKRK